MAQHRLIKYALKKMFIALLSAGALLFRDSFFRSRYISFARRDSNIYVYSRVLYVIKFASLSTRERNYCVTDNYFCKIANFNIMARSSTYRRWQQQQQQQQRRTSRGVQISISARYPPGYFMRGGGGVARRGLEGKNNELRGRLPVPPFALSSSYIISVRF